MRKVRKPGNSTNYKASRATRVELYAIHEEKENSAFSLTGDFYTLLFKHTLHILLVAPTPHTKLHNLLNFQIPFEIR